MGTFHDTNDPLHGVTVAVETGDRVYVGRCHERDSERIVLLDADEHEDGAEGLERAEYLERAAKFGVWKKHDRLVLDAATAERIEPLGSYYRRPGSAGAPEIARKMPESGDAAGAAVPAANEIPLMSETGPSGEAVNLTDAAAGEVRRLIAAGENEGPGLRLGVAGGGCSGLVYKIEFSEPRDGDLVVRQDGFDVLLDPKSSIYLRDVTLDYEGGLGGRGFQFRNPNASNTCGCGESFAV